MALRAAIYGYLILAIILPMGLVKAAEAPPEFTTGQSRVHPLIGRGFEPALGRFVELDEVVTRALAADIVLLGETHDNADHHALQAWMVRRMIEGGRRPAVAFEMIDESQREPLERHLAGNPGDAAGLGPALEWDKTGWPDWRHYRPIAEAALAAGSAPLPANLSRDSTRALAGGQAPELAARLGLDEPMDRAMNEAMANEIKVGHCDMLPDKAVPPMVRVQFARDATMARAMASALEEGRQAILIAGAGHVRNDRAVPWHLNRLTPGSSVLALAFVEVSDGETDPAAYGDLYGAERLPFDLVVFTPRQEREDQCDVFRKHMEKKSKDK